MTVTIAAVIQPRMVKMTTIRSSEDLQLMVILMMHLRRDLAMPMAIPV
jgi:hypothetical protein